MSYILDALRRAEAERERGAVPGLHDQPFNPAADEAAGARAARPALWMAAGAGAVVLVAIGAYALWPDTPPPAVAMAPIATPAPPPLAPLAQRPAPAAVIATAPPAVPSPAPSPAPVAAPAPRPAYIDAPPPEPKPVPRKPATATSEAAAGNASSAATAAAPPASAPRVYAISELPDAVRRELPKLSLGGSMYSDNAANRMLIVNGQVLHEGDKLNADLSLDKIKLKSAVFAYKGYRYELGY